MNRPSDEFESFDGVLYTKGRNKLVSYPASRRKPEFRDEAATEIVEGAFKGCADIERVFLPEYFYCTASQQNQIGTTSQLFLNDFSS
jgi:hypothetical protein